MREQLLVVTGVPEVCQLKANPEILKQVGLKQYDQIKGLLGGAQAAQTAAVEEDDDDVPTLVGDTNFEKVVAAQ